MIEQVWLRASAAEKIDRLIIATDDSRVLDTATGFGAEAMMTSPDHASGTDRVAEVVRTLGERGGPDQANDGFRVVLNIQGDEPLLTPSALDRLIAAFDRVPPPQVATLSEPIRSAEQLFDPNVVKLVTADDGRALYFSRSAIPYHRGQARTLRADFRKQLADREGGVGGYRKHQGIYAYTPEALLELTSLAPSPLELDEGLEQLRALQAGYSIHVIDSDFHSLSVDKPADLARVARVLTEAN
jgi:3-deoxy-manno-octulosonate cytidylyltransferase (CMP-KDO synthetase)